MQENIRIDSYITNCNFSKSNFNNSKIDVKRISKCNFSNVTFNESRISCFYWSSDSFNICNFNNASFKKADIIYPFFISCSFINVNFYNTRIGKNGKIEYCSFKNAVFYKTKFDDTIHYVYKKTKFTSCNFTNANLHGVINLNNAKFVNCDFKYAKVDKKWKTYLKTQSIKNFDKIVWVDAEYYKIKAKLKKFKSQIYSGKEINLSTYKKLKNHIKYLQKKYPNDNILKQANALIEYLELKLIEYVELRLF